MSTDVLVTGSAIAIDEAAVLRALKLDPRDVNAQAVLLVCQRYGLDPILRHMLLIEGRPYVTRDGLLHVAHRSGQLDGIEVLEERAEPGEWIAKVAVYRKDMSRPFAYTGRYSGQNKKYGPEMAIKTAEVMALRRAFDVTGIAVMEEQAEKWDRTIDAETGEIINHQPPTDQERWEAEPIFAPSPQAQTYLREWLANHGYDEAAYKRELKARNLKGDTLVGVITGTFPDLTGGGSPPAESPGAGYEPTAADVNFYGSREAAIEHPQREQAAQQQPAVAA